MLNRNVTQSPILTARHDADNDVSESRRDSSLPRISSSNSFHLQTMSPARRARLDSFTPAQFAARFRTGHLGTGFPRESGHGNDDDISYAQDIAPVPTPMCLQNFVAVLAHKIEPAIRYEKRMILEERQRERRRHQAVLQKLRAWKDWQILNKSMSFNVWWKKLRVGNQHKYTPNQASLVNMVLHFYPLRADVKVYICDFGLDKFEKQEVSLSTITQYLNSKPQWADVRWIHAPLNVGLVQSSLEELFLKERRNPNIAHTQNSSWPYAEVETLSIYKHDDLKDMQDVFQILHEYRDHPALSKVIQTLDEDPLKDMTADLQEDIQWRADHWGMPITHWSLALPDFQRQLSNLSTEFIDLDFASHAKSRVEKQALSRSYFYRRAQLVKSAFRCFHSSDGFLLTMCADGGIDYIDKLLDERLDQPAGTTLLDENGSLIGLMFALFSKTGSSTWHKRNVDWFLIYLLTEVAAKPHNFRQGGNGPSLLKAYQDVVQGLKEKRYAEFKRKESVKVVREYLACIDELTTMSMIWSRSMNMLERLKAQAEEIEKNNSFHGNPEGESAQARILWACKVVEDNDITTKELLVDLQKALAALFQVRSIEQNELAIVADNQNKAVLIFTGVTIVFLPLSFFTSYFGMNLQGIANTARTEEYFWKLCGTLGFFIILSVTLYVFRQGMAQRLRRTIEISRV